MFVDRERERERETEGYIFSRQIVNVEMKKKKKKKTLKQFQCKIFYLNKLPLSGKVHWAKITTQLDYKGLRWFIKCERKIEGSLWARIPMLIDKWQKTGHKGSSARFRVVSFLDPSLLLKTPIQASQTKYLLYPCFFMAQRHGHY